mmetsp:Transcript_146456/g.469869  ORF Transcript_146456/g.469869 Transcript_146456/m.469869 type:complete len:200 (-) Transcript_146456:163-762(-)
MKRLRSGRVAETAVLGSSFHCGTRGTCMAIVESDVVVGGSWSGVARYPLRHSAGGSCSFIAGESIGFTVACDGVDVWAEEFCDRPVAQEPMRTAAAISTGKMHCKGKQRESDDSSSGVPERIAASSASTTLRIGYDLVASSVDENAPEHVATARSSGIFTARRAAFFGQQGCIGAGSWSEAGGETGVKSPVARRSLRVC